MQLKGNKKYFKVYSLITLLIFLCSAPLIYYSFFHIPENLLLNGYQYEASISLDKVMVMNYLSQVKNEHLDEFNSITQLLENELKQADTNNVAISFNLQRISDELIFVNVTNIKGFENITYLYNPLTQTLSSNLIFSNEFKHMIRNEFIVAARNSDAYSSIAYSSQFIDIIDNSDYLSYWFYDEPGITFKYDFGYGELSVSKDMRYYMDDINVDLNIESLNSVNKYSTLKSNDLNQKVIYLMINHAFDRGIDFKWIDTLSYYGQSASFVVLGNKIEGNHDVILSALNHNMGLINGTQSKDDLMDLNDIELDHELFGPVRAIDQISQHTYSMKLLYIEESINSIENFTLVNPDIHITDYQEITLDTFKQLETQSIVMVDDHLTILESILQLIPDLMDNNIQIRALANQ